MSDNDLPPKSSDLGFARVDLEREARTGVAESIFGEGKSPHQIVEISRALLDNKQNVVVTRADADAMDAMGTAFDDAVVHPEARVITVTRQPPPMRGTVAVVCAGTTDRPVAQECRVCAEAWGAQVISIDDVGVAGLHRVLAVQEKLNEADVVVVVAGMDGALPSVIAGLVAPPVIAVPTSVGYGAAFEGLAPLLSMLNACAEGVVVVNIDNGFGAARAAIRFLSRRR